MKYFLPALATIAALTLTPKIAHASSYTSPSGLTQLTVDQASATPGTGGAYIVRIGSTDWSGKFNATSITGGAGHIYYSGTFVDRPLNSTNTQCIGNIVLDTTHPTGPSNPTSPHNMIVRWTVTGGTNCPMIGTTTFSLPLTESLPVPTSSGNFTPANSMTRFQWVNGRDVWPKWKVVDPDPNGLRCRSTPSGSTIVQTFLPSSAINVLMFDTSGNWLKVPPSSGYSSCYIRAKSTFIKPMQIPY